VLRALVFDWGDTIMRVFSDYDGPMASWPRVEAIPGVEDVLRSLRPRYRLALATNAAESGEALVRAALRRVGLEPYFDAVLTARELGARKPEPAFFQGVLGRLGCAPHEVTMIGDDYWTDVVGARQAGLRTVWFNPAGEFAPSDDSEGPDAVIRSWPELEAALQLLDSRAGAGRPQEDK